MYLPLVKVINNNSEKKQRLKINQKKCHKPHCDWWCGCVYNLITYIIMRFKHKEVEILVAFVEHQRYSPKVIILCALSQERVHFSFARKTVQKIGLPWHVETSRLSTKSKQHLICQLDGVWLYFVNVVHEFLYTKWSEVWKEVWMWVRTCVTATTPTWSFQFEVYLWPKFKHQLRTLTSKQNMWAADESRTLSVPVKVCENFAMTH